MAAQDSERFVIVCHLLSIRLFNKFSNICVCFVLPFDYFHPQIYVFECYVRDLCDLLRNSVKYFQESEACTKAVHNRKISKLQEELKRYRALPGTGNCEAQQQEILHMMK